MIINRNRKKGEDLGAILNEMKVGDQPVFDEVTGWDITKVPGGFIYKNEYAGAVFVPEKEKPIVKNAVVKTEPKGKIEK